MQICSIVVGVLVFGVVVRCQDGFGGDPGGYAGPYSRSPGATLPRSGPTLPQPGKRRLKLFRPYWFISAFLTEATIHFEPLLNKQPLERLSAL